MLTNEDIQKIIKANQEIFATKEDLKAFATKEDLEAFATKEDLEENSSKLLNEIFSTKNDLENFKDEMRESFSNLQTFLLEDFSKFAKIDFVDLEKMSRKTR